MTEQEKQKFLEGLRAVAASLRKSADDLNKLTLGDLNKLTLGDMVNDEYGLMKPDASKPREYRKVGTERETRIVDLLKKVHAGGGVTATQLAVFTGSTKTSVYTALHELKTKYDIVERRSDDDSRIKFFSIAN